MRCARLKRLGDGVHFFGDEVRLVAGVFPNITRTVVEGRCVEAVRRAVAAVQGKRLQTVLRLTASLALACCSSSACRDHELQSVVREHRGGCRLSGLDRRRKTSAPASTEGSSQADRIRSLEDWKASHTWEV
mmetsp:Transcript_115968/g.368856  ORF Transcript_115968/g.368856 Transcript_115968/m.368856 type:complete len:132 (+) Transcript_115968:287-682(+)